MHASRRTGPPSIVRALAALGAFGALGALIAPTGFAAFVIDEITVAPGAASTPALAVTDAHGTALAYLLVLPDDPQTQVAVQMIETTAPPWPTVLPDPFVAGPGRLPRVCWSQDGFTLAYVHQDTVRVLQAGHDGDWSAASEHRFAPGGEVLDLDLWGVPGGPGGQTVFLVVDDRVGEGASSRHRIHFASSGQYTGWSSLALRLDDLLVEPRSRVSYVLGPTSPWPAIYFLQGEEWMPELYEIHRLDVGWSAPAPVPGGEPGIPLAIAGEFDVAQAGDLGILGLGMQPTCPCGSIHFVARCEIGGWRPQQDVTAVHDHYDWPFSPRIAVTARAYAMHLFWLQESRSENLQSVRQHLEYRRFRDGEMEDAGGFLDVPYLQRGLGERVDVGVSWTEGLVVLAWSKTDTIDGAPQPEQINVARTHWATGAPDAGVPPAAGLELTAHPNPFNPRVNLELTMPAARSIRLGIYDARGRLVRRLHEGPLPAGRHAFAWDGRRDDGRRAAGGVYLIKAAGEGHSAARKVVLVE